jgi:serpin B
MTQDQTNQPSQNRADANSGSDAVQRKSQSQSDLGTKQSDNADQDRSSIVQTPSKVLPAVLILVGLVLFVFFVSNLFQLPSILNVGQQTNSGSSANQNQPTRVEPDLNQDTDQADSVNTTDTTGSGAESFNQAVNKLSWDLYQSFVQDQAKTDNIFYSPFSVSTALTMTYEGARGKTATEMQQALSLPLDKNKLRQSYSQVMQAVNQSDHSYQLKTANALWAQQDYHFLDSFIETNQNYYQAKLENLDFVGSPTQSVEKINGWVAEQTENKITNLLNQSDLTDMTRLVLTNAIYFLGDWQYQFNQDMTMPDVFYSPDGEKEVEMMQLDLEQTKLKHAQLENWQVLELPYDGQELSMLIFLPEFDQTSPGTSLDQKRSSLTWEKVNSWQKKMESKEIQVYLPKFKLKTRYYLRQNLKQLGMNQAFGMAADFSGMTGNQDLFISKVIHQAMVEVDEKGTEAAASTAVVAELKSAPGAGKEEQMFRADHPFLFMIKHNPTDTILFMGEVNEPSSS